MSKSAFDELFVEFGAFLRDAGLGRVPGVTAKSIRLGVAQQVLHSDGLEAAARFLGSRSLDGTAASLRYEWSVQ